MSLSVILMGVQKTQAGTQVASETVYYMRPLEHPLIVFTVSLHNVAANIGDDSSVLSFIIVT